MSEPKKSRAFAPWREPKWFLLATLLLGCSSPAPFQQPVAAPKRATPSNAGGPVRRMQTALATAIESEPDWKEF